MQIADTPEKIEAFRFLAMKGMLKLEAKGMKRRGESIRSILKRELGFKGNAAQMVPQLEAYLKERGILP